MFVAVQRRLQIRETLAWSEAAVTVEGGGVKVGQRALCLFGIPL